MRQKIQEPALGGATRPLTLLSVNNYHYLRGGAEAVFFGQNRMFADNGWNVVPFSMHHPENLPSEWSDHFVSEVELGHAESVLDKVRQAPKTVYSFEARRKVRALIERTRPDICHVHNLYHHISPSVLGAIKGYGIPIVMTLHDLKIACPAYKMLNSSGVCEACRGGKLHNVIRNKCIKDSYLLSGLVYVEAALHKALNTYQRFVDRFVVPSDFYRRKLIEWGIPGEKLTLIPNFLDVRREHRDVAASDEFLYFGRLAPEKGTTTLIDASARAEAKVHVVGTGPEEQTLRLRAREIDAPVRFSGYLTGDRLSAAIASAYAVIVPSEWYENAPMSVLEAYAMARPVIGADIGGIPELVKDGETGYLFKSGDAHDLTTALGRMKRCGASGTRTMGLAGLKLVQQRHAPSQYFSALTDLYREVGLRSSPPPGGR